jgi:hypothetical protein
MFTISQKGDRLLAVLRPQNGGVDLTCWIPDFTNAQFARPNEAHCLDPQTGQITDAALFSLYLRYQTTHTRAFHKCLNELLKLRSERRKTENGFEARNRKNGELRIQNERHEMKKDHHFWDVRLKDAAFCHRTGQNLANFNKAIRENPGFEAQYIAEVDRLLQNRRPEVATATA